MLVHVATDPVVATERAARTIAEHLESAIGARGRAGLALSGGRSPIGLFDALAARDIVWDRVHVFQVDERVVGPDHPACNGRAIREHLLVPTGARDHLLVLDDDMSPSAQDLAADGMSRSLHETLGPTPRLDVVHLGLGADGHTASWPPGQPITNSRLVTTVRPFNGHRRLTMTPLAVNAARQVVWFVLGADKQDALARLLDGDPSIPATSVTVDDQILFEGRYADGGAPPVWA